MKMKRISFTICYKKLLSLFIILFPSICFAQVETDIISIINHGLGSYSVKKKQHITQAIVSNANKIFESENLSLEEKPIMVIFFDYNCGHCKLIDQKILSFHDAHPEVKIIYKEFPIRGKESRFAAKAAIASQSQGSYTTFHQALFQLEEITPYSVIDTAKKLNLNIPKLNRDMESTETYQVISDNYALAKDLKLIGTPSFLIYGIDKDKNPHIYYIQGALAWKTLEEYLIGIN